MLIAELTGCNPCTDGQDRIRKELSETEAVTPEDADQWRVRYLCLLLEQRQ